MTVTQLILVTLNVITILIGVWCMILGFGLMDHNNSEGGYYFIGGSILFGFSILSLNLSFNRTRK